MLMNFNRNAPVFGNVIEEPSTDLIKNTFGLFRASVEDALRYGGDITREAIGAMNIRNDKKYVLVDVKVHMLMQGFCPAIPGWHTDGVPRPKMSQSGKGAPDIELQESMDSPRFHLLTTGDHCSTMFAKARNIMVNVPSVPSNRLYADINKQMEERVQAGTYQTMTAPRQVVEFDWWELHTAVYASKFGWRYLIRVTESDTMAPLTNLRDIIKTQAQVYTPANIGW